MEIPLEVQYKGTVSYSAKSSLLGCCAEDMYGSKDNNKQQDCTGQKQPMNKSTKVGRRGGKIRVK
jgi:hypothetical protein